MKSDLVYLGHILQSVQDILDYTKGIDETAFLSNKMLRDAVIRNLEIIGEATKKISKPTREKYSQISWKRMAGMRDKLIHDYFGVDSQAVWGVVDEILPSLKKHLIDIIEAEKQS